MNSYVRVLILVILGLCGAEGLKAQEVITPLFGHPGSSGDQRDDAVIKKSAGEVLLELPFFDDFSNYSIRPDPGSWSDASAFVNNQYCIDPVTNGVATLDALDDDGSIYPNATISPQTFVADLLTSHPINLEYPASDSIYLSFLYQPHGLGDMPEEKDSLLVDFYDPVLGVWINSWGIPGDTLHPFMHAMIPVTDNRFLKSGFRFRFRNRASLPSNKQYPDKRANVDHWNVDYVRLDRNRFASDTVLRDVAFVSPINSILKDLTSLPWSQFDQAFFTVLDTAITARYRNNDTITRNVTRSLTIHEPIYNESSDIHTPTAQDLAARKETSVNFVNIYTPNFDRGDSAIIRYKAALRTDEFDPKVNDTVILDQLFKDYWSYDDGTAEAGYGLRGQGTSNSSAAIKYHSYAPDLLGGVEVCFNQLYDSVNLGVEYSFKLMVWADSEGEPGQILHEDENDFIPQYTSGYPDLIRYHFSRPVAVDGTFYVGWRQYNQYMLNVGLDRNNRPVPPVMFYNFTGTWQSSMAPGVIMFRPFQYNESTGLQGPPPATRSLHVYPNPASDWINFTLPEGTEEQGAVVEIFDSSGRLVISRNLQTNSIHTGSLSAGIYYLRARTSAGNYHSKIVVNR